MSNRHQITIKGYNVQRCGFRNLAAQMARRLELRGTATYVDHDLIIEVEGNWHMISLFTDWCKKGPRDCQIDNMEVVELPPVDYTTFEIVQGVLSSNLHAVVK